MKTLRSVLPLLAAGLLASHAHAQGWKDGPHLGWPSGGDTRDDNMAAGWQVTYEFPNPYSLDLSVTRQTDELRGEDSGSAFFPARGSIDTDIYAIALTLRAGFRPHERLTVYAGAGPGFYIFNTDAEDVRIGLDADPVSGGAGQVTEANLDVDKDFGFHWAIGAEFLLNDRWEVFVEYRDVSFETDAEVEAVETVPGATFDQSKVTHREEVDFNYDYGMVRAGFNYRF